jgi:hypothetical protein
MYICIYVCMHSKIFEQNEPQAGPHIHTLPIFFFLDRCLHGMVRPLALTLSLCVYLMSNDLGSRASAQVSHKTVTQPRTLETLLHIYKITQLRLFYAFYTCVHTIFLYIVICITVASRTLRVRGMIMFSYLEGHFHSMVLFSFSDLFSETWKRLNKNKLK